MKAIRLERTGGPERLEYVEVPTPKPGSTSSSTRWPGRASLSFSIIWRRSD